MMLEEKRQPLKVVHLTSAAFPSSCSTALHRPISTYNTQNLNPVNLLGWEQAEIQAATKGRHKKSFIIGVGRVTRPERDECFVKNINVGMFWQNINVRMFC